MKKLVIWYNPNKDIYYYRIVRGIFYERYDYKEGSVNNYGHVIVLIIPIYNIKINTPKPHNFLHSLSSKCSSFLK